MNILYLCDEYPPALSGGVGSSVKVLAEAMLKNGHNVCVAGLYPSFRKIDAPYKVENGIKVWKQSYFPIQSSILSKGIINLVLKKYLKIRFKNYIKFLEEIIIKNDIQIIEIPDYQEIFYDTYSELINYEFDIPIVVKTHGSYSYLHAFKNIKTSNGLLRKEKLLYSSAAAIICLSEFSKQNALNLYGLQNEFKMHVIPHGLSIKKRSILSRETEIKVIFAGSLTPTKGIFQLIEAWNIVQSRSNRKVQLAVYGKYDSQTLADLKSLIERKYLDTIVFYGHVEKTVLESAFQSSYLAVLPSYFETFGMVAIEAMSNGCPVIFTNRASGPEVINDGVDGYLIDPESPEDIAEKIILLLNNSNLRESMSINAINAIDVKFNLDTIVKRHIDLYETIIG